MEQVRHIPPAVSDLSASCKLVFLAVKVLDEPTPTEISEAMELPPRTVRYALRRLEEKGAVEGRTSLQDARQSHYSVVE